MPNPLILAADLVAITILSYGLYFRRYRRREMVFAYVALNAGAMALTTILSTANVGTGLGLGLFGVLSIIRLRSSEISHEEVAYYFVSLALGLLAGFQPDPLWVAPALSAMLLALAYVADHPALGSTHRRQIVKLDAAYTDEAKLITRLEELLDAEVTHVVVTELDLVRDQTEVDVRFRLRAAAARSTKAAPSEHEAADDDRAVRTLAVARQR